MINNQLHTTSSLLRERNILGVSSNQSSVACYRKSILHGGKTCCLQNGDSRSIGSLCILFMESLIERDFQGRTVVAIGRDLRSFFAYIEEKHGITAEISALKRSHVEEYAAIVRGTYEAGAKTFTDALDANGLLGAVRLFFLYLHRAGAIAEDYGYAAPPIPFPDGEDV